MMRKNTFSCCGTFRQYKDNLSKMTYKTQTEYRANRSGVGNQYHIGLKGMET